MQNVTKDTPERLGHLVLLQGKTQTTVPEIKAGDIGAVAKLKESQTSDVIAEKAVAVHARRAIKFPEPVISYAIEPKSRGDEEKISTALHRLQEEDPTINYTRDAQTKELLLAGQGQLAHRGDGREAQTALRRRGPAEAAADPLPRDDHGRHRSARPAQEADRRPRPVRRLQGEVRAAAARQPTSSSSTTSSAGRFRASSSRRSRRGSRTRGCAASSPATRWSTSARASSTDRSTRSTRAKCRSRWPARWPSRTACRGRGRRCSSRSWTSRSTRRATTPGI